MNNFVAAFLVVMVLAAVGNFASDGTAFSGHCGFSWLQICR
jgi:hypothetical protein